MSRSDAIRFCATSDFHGRRSVTRWIDELGDEVTVVRVHGGLLARSSVCPHFGGPLAIDPERGRMRCAWHGWEFDLETGACLSYSLPGIRVRPYRAVERDGYIEIEVGDEDRRA